MRPKTTEEIIGLLFLGIIMAIIEILAICVLWNMLIIPLFGLPKLTFGNAILLKFLIALFIPSHTSLERR